MLSSYSMKRNFCEVADDEMLDWLAQKAQESALQAEKKKAANVQNFFYPKQSIPEKEQKNAQYHINAVLAVLNEKNGTRLKSSFVLSFMRDCWEVDGERITRFMQYVVQESYCITRSANKRKNEINKILTAIEQDVQMQQYILTGESVRVTRAKTAWWQDDMQDAFNAVQRYQDEQQKTYGLRTLNSLTKN